MRKILSILVVCLLIFGLTGCKDQGDTIVNIASQVNIGTKVSGILPKPGTDSSGFMAGTIPSWCQSTDWIGCLVFRLFADPDQYDPDMGTWGVENIRNSMKIAGVIAENATVSPDAGTRTGTVGDLEFTIDVAAATASSALTTTFGPGFANTSGVTYEYQRDFSVSAGGSIDIKVAWLNQGGIYYLLENEIHSTEYSHMEGAV